MKKAVLFILSICVVIMVAIMIASIVQLNAENERMAENLNWYNGTYLHKSGATTMVPGVNSYNLLSTNGGRDWYALGQYQKILGPVEEIYPGLLAHIDGMDALLNHVNTYGAIGSQGRMTSDEISLLEKAGFAVQSQTN